MTNNNKYIISGSKDKTVRVWNFFEKTQETVLVGHKSYVKSVAMTSDKKFIISISDDDIIRV